MKKKIKGDKEEYKEKDDEKEMVAKKFKRK